MDFQLNEEQLQLKKSVREFAEREIAPNVMKWDEASEFPLATVKELGKLGLMGMIFPPEYGGAGMGYVEYVTAIAELARVDGSVGIMLRRIPPSVQTIFSWRGTRRRRRSMCRNWPPASTSARGG